MLVPVIVSDAVLDVFVSRRLEDKKKVLILVLVQKSLG